MHIRNKQCTTRFNENLTNLITTEENNFMSQTHRNVHDQDHSSKCFKKGTECRSKLPKPFVQKMSVDFPVNLETEWVLWTGENIERMPCQIKLQRDPLDVFMNPCNEMITNVLNCNSNVQVDIDVPGMTHCTCHVFKSN